MTTKVGTRRPESVTDVNSNWTGESPAALDPGEPVVHGGGAASITSAQGTGDTLRINSFFAPPGDIFEITAVKSIVRQKSATGVPSTDGTRIDITMDWSGAGSLSHNNQALYDSSYTNTAFTWDTHPSGDPWSLANIGDTSIRTFMAVNAWLGTNTGWDVDSFYLEITYVIVPAQIGSARDVPSRRLFDLYRTQPMLSKKLLSMKDGMKVGMLDPVLVSQYEAPDSEESGWLPDIPKRRILTPVSRTIDPMKHNVELELRDLRPFMCLYRDTMWPLKSSAPWAEGVARHSHRGGVGRVFTRDSPAWIPDPGDGKYARIEVDQEKYGQNGEYFEQQETNEVLNSGFRLGATDTFDSWTKSLTGGSTVTENTSAESWWDSGIVTRVAQFNFDAASEGALLQQTTGSVPANTVVVCAVTTQDVGSAAPMKIALRRELDSDYWNEAGGTWDAGSPVWNPITVSADAWSRTTVMKFDIEGTASAMRISIGLADADVSGAQTNYLTSVELLSDAGLDYLTTPILTDTAALTREADSLLISNNLNYRNWNADQGAFACEVSTLWASADIGNVNKTVLYLEYDANDYVWLYYDGTNDRFVFDRTRGGTTWSCTVDKTVTANTWIKLVCRWAGENGESTNDYDQHLFVDGTKSSVATPDGPPEEANVSDIEIGSKSAGEFWDGQIRLFHSFSHYPTDTECLRLPPR